MNITKTQFVEIIDAVIEQMDRDEKISKALDVVAADGGNHTLVFVTPLAENIIATLDHDNIISWWFWDGCKHGEEADKYAIYDGDPNDENTKRIPIRNASDLYDYMESVK